MTYDAGSDSIELRVHKILNIKVKLTAPESQVDELLAHRATQSKMAVGETNGVTVLAQTLVGKATDARLAHTVTLAPPTPTEAPTPTESVYIGGSALGRR